MSRSPLNPSLAEVQEAIRRAIDELEEPLTRKERKRGWLDETRSTVTAQLRAIRDDIDGGVPPHPRDLPSQVDVFRGLDAMGVDVVGDPLGDRVMYAFALARRYANRHKDRD